MVAVTQSVARGGGSVTGVDEKLRGEGRVCLRGGEEEMGKEMGVAAMGWRSLYRHGGSGGWASRG
jgi:hypothetical protein